MDSLKIFDVEKNRACRKECYRGRSSFLFSSFFFPPSFTFIFKVNKRYVYYLILFSLVPSSFSSPYFLSFFQLSFTSQSFFLLLVLLLLLLLIKKHSFTCALVSSFKGLIRFVEILAML